MSSKVPPKASAVFAGVDWISATLGRDEIDAQVWLYDAIYALERIAMEGNKYVSRKLLGFDGWECGGCFVGSNEKLHYAQFAGHHAESAYTYLDHPKVHISRIDIQISVQYTEHLIKEGRLHYAHAIRYNKGLPEHKRRKVHLFAGSEGADTVYIGAPSSDTRGRIYNKQLQSGDPRYDKCWRFEVVLKNDYAMPVFRRLIDTPDAGKAVIIPSVVRYFAERGITIRDVGAREHNAITPPKAAPTDVERKMRWIKNQVVPTIRVLCEMGYGAEVGEMLANALVPPDPHTQEGGSTLT